MGQTVSQSVKHGVVGVAEAYFEDTAQGASMDVQKMLRRGVKKMLNPPAPAGETESKMSSTLMAQDVESSDTLEAVCAIMSSSLYFAGCHTLVLNECNGHRATAFYLTEEHVEKKEIFSYISDGTCVELLDEKQKVTVDDGKPWKPIKIRFNGLSGYVRQMHCGEPSESVADYEEELKRLLEAEEWSKSIDVKLAKIVAWNSLLNKIALAVVQIGDECDLIIAWAGTEAEKRPMDVFTDLGASPAACHLWHKAAPGLHAHGAIMAQTASNYLIFKDLVLSRLQQFGCRRLVFTGHSLGGGCALMAHMCVLGQTQDGELRDNPVVQHVSTQSITFAAPMVFYKALRDDTPEHADTSLLLLGIDASAFNDDFEKKKARIQQESERESALRTLFQRTSRNFVCAMDVIPRLPGKPGFYTPAVREALTSMAKSSIMSLLQVQTEVTSQAAAKLVERFFEQPNMQRTLDDLKCFEHLSAIVYMNTDFSLETLTPEQFLGKEHVDVGEDQAYQYYLSCHSFFPQKMKYSAGAQN